MSNRVLLMEQLNAATTLLTLNRPDRRNALTIELLDAICTAFESLAEQSSQRVVIVAGADPVFCAGLDLQEAAQPELAERSAHAVARLFQVISQSPLISIAAAQGAAYAGGAGLLACCDFAIASDDLKLAFPEVRRGLLPALVAALLSNRVREGDVKELFLTAESVSASRAQQMGLIHRVVPRGSVIDESRKLASTVLKGAPDAVRQTKRLLAELRTPSLSQLLDQTLTFHRQARASGEAAEGIAAFLEHREPNWLQDL